MRRKSEMKEIVNGMTNEMKLEFDSRSANEAFARVTVASFMTQLNPTLEEVADDMWMTVTTFSW